MKKLIGILMVIVLAFGVMGCSSDNKSETSSMEKETDQKKESLTETAKVESEETVSNVKNVADYYDLSVKAANIISMEMVNIALDNGIEDSPTFLYEDVTGTNDKYVFFNYCSQSEVKLSFLFEVETEHIQMVTLKASDDDVDGKDFVAAMFIVMNLEEFNFSKEDINTTLEKLANGSSEEKLGDYTMRWAFNTFQISK